MSETKRKFHNLDGLARDLRAALVAGEQRIYEFAELLCECLDLVEAPEEGDDDADQLPDGAGDGEDGLLDSDGSVGAMQTSPQLGGSLQADLPGIPGVVPVPRSEALRERLPVGSAPGAGGGPADGRASVLSDEELVAALKARGLNPDGRQRFAGRQKVSDGS